MELKTRGVHFAGCTTNPHENWMKQVGRELMNFEDGLLNDKAENRATRPQATDCSISSISSPRWLAAPDCFLALSVEISPKGTVRSVSFDTF